MDSGTVDYPYVDRAWPRSGRGGKRADPAPSSPREDKLDSWEGRRYRAGAAGRGRDVGSGSGRTKARPPLAAGPDGGRRSALPGLAVLGAPLDQLHVGAGADLDLLTLRLGVRSGNAHGQHAGVV